MEGSGRFLDLLSKISRTFYPLTNGAYVVGNEMGIWLCTFAGWHEGVELSLDYLVVDRQGNFVGETRFPTLVWDCDGLGKDGNVRVEFWDSVECAKAYDRCEYLTGSGATEGWGRVNEYGLTRQYSSWEALWENNPGVRGWKVAV